MDVRLEVCEQQHPAEAILDVAHLSDATEIVIGSRHRGRLTSITGSVVTEVLQGAQLPVVVVQ